MVGRRVECCTRAVVPISLHLLEICPTAKNLS
jgi:hypothetical protein